MKTVMIGGGRFAGVIHAMFGNTHEFTGYIDDVSDGAYVEKIYQVPFLGQSKNLEKLLSFCENVVVTIGTEGSTAARRAYFQRFLDAGFSFPSLVHPSAFMPRNVVVGKGTIVQVNAVVHPMVKLGNNCVISTSAIIGHDSVLGDNVYIGPGVIINGSVEIGDDTFIGTGAVVIQKRVIGSNCIIGASSCVIKDIPDNSTAVGVPAHIVDPNRPSTTTDLHISGGTNRPLATHSPPPLEKLQTAKV